MEKTEKENMTIDELLHLGSLLYKTRDEVSEISNVIADNFDANDKITLIAKASYKIIEKLRSELNARMAIDYPFFSKQIQKDENSYYE